MVNSRVRSIRQDSRGRMYFITYGGLSIYDGTRFTNYSQEDGLANELVNDVLEMGPDSMIVATNTQKLNTLVHGRIGTFKTEDNFYPVINRLLQTRDGQVYAAADEGLFVLKNNCFEHLILTSAQGRETGLYLDKIMEWDHFLLLIPWTTEQKEKLILYDKWKGKVTDLYTSEKVVSTAVDGYSRVWITTARTTKLLDTAALRRGKLLLTDLPTGFGGASGLKNMVVFLDRAGTAWFYSGNKILKISPFETPQLISADQGLKTSTIADLYRDREGTVWMACDGNGIVKMKSTDVQLITGFAPGSTSNISSMQQASDTSWFFNMTNNSVHRLYRNRLSSFHLQANRIKATNMYLQKKRLYLCSDRQIICISNKDNPLAYQHPKTILQSAAPKILIGNGIIDPNGFLILHLRKGDTGYYLSVWKEDRFIMEYRLALTADQMAMDQKGNLWVTSRDNHILVFTLHKDEPSRYLRLLHDYSKELPVMGPRSIAVDKAGHIWIGTRYHGVYQFMVRNEKLVVTAQFTTRNGLTDNFALTLKCGDSNTIWVGTETGLDKIFLKKGKYIVGNVSKNNNFFQSIYKIQTSKDHTVWALTNEGSVMKISPASYYSSSPPPEILLTSFRVNNESYDGPFPVFSHDQNNFTFSLAAPSFIDERSVRYSYLLEGSNSKAWSIPTNNAIFNFINLSPGHYKLIVRADFPEALYDTQFVSYPFTISGPWWKTWWFLLLLIVFAMAISALIIRTYYHQKLEKQKYVLEKKQAVEKERTRIATDMHDDLGAGLSRIKFLSELIGIKKQQKRSIEEDITKIREYAHEMIDKMGEIVWALNEKNDSLSDLIAYTRAYAVEYLAQSGINCAFQCPETFPAGLLRGEFRRNIFLSVKECLHNVVKHAQANEVQITIRTSENLNIIIEDDGVGFNLAHSRPFSNGLTNICKRMKEIGGTMELKNKNGTTMDLSAPLAL